MREIKEIKKDKANSNLNNEIKSNFSFKIAYCASSGCCQIDRDFTISNPRLGQETLKVPQLVQGGSSRDYTGLERPDICKRYWATTD